MAKTSLQFSLGFSLLELLISLVIVSLLASVAYPSYRDHMTSARRADAQAVMLEAAQYMQRFYTENNRYDLDSDGAAVALPTYLQQSPRDAGTKAYDISVQASAASSFTLRATPKNSQAGDGFLELTHSFSKAWDRDNSGAIDAGEFTWSH
jgi:type IV pilus assembly protein PilE